VISRDVVGRRIVGVIQEIQERAPSGDQPIISVLALVLDNGTQIQFRGTEIEYGDPVATATVVKQPRSTTPPRPRKEKPRVLRRGEVQAWLGGPRK
jgi:hypothetical protein